MPLVMVLLHCQCDWMGKPSSEDHEGVSREV